LLAVYLPIVIKTFKWKLKAEVSAADLKRPDIVLVIHLILADILNLIKKMAEISNILFYQTGIFLDKNTPKG
jgi:hypothetical protein